MCVKTDGDNELDLAVDKDQQIFVLEHEIAHLDAELLRYKKALNRACKHLDSLGDGCEACEYLGKCGLFENRDCIQGMCNFFLSDKKLPYEPSILEAPKNE